MLKITGKYYISEKIKFYRLFKSTSYFSKGNQKNFQNKKGKNWSGEDASWTCD